MKVCGVAVALVFMLSLPAGIRNAYDEGTECRTAALSRGNETVTIIRDAYGVPHVFAETRDALSYGAGYAVAEDRLWQAELNRRQASGRLAEIGIGSVEYDHFMRLIDYTPDEYARLYDNLSSELKNMLAAYVAGMNRYIAEARTDISRKMPLEFLQHGIEPEPWTVRDVMAITQMEAKAWGIGGGYELYAVQLLYQLLLRNGVRDGWRILNDRLPVNDPGAETTIAGEHAPKNGEVAAWPPWYPPCILEYAAVFERLRNLEHDICERHGLLYQFGSNGWVVGPEKSASGNPLLLGGPQMGHTIPQIVMELGLHGAGIDVVGMTFAGSGPIVAIGASRWGAWMIPMGTSDTLDTYIEVLHPFDRTKYFFEGRFCDMTVRTEVIYDAEGEPHEFDIMRTVHGPTMHVGNAPIAVSQKISFWMQDVAFAEGFVRLQGCRNVSDFVATVKNIPTSHSFMWADRNGDICYYHTGWYPLRPERGVLNRRIDDRFPLWGTGREEWQGLVAAEDLPHETNPATGFYANFNNKPRPDWPYAEFENFWGEGQGVRRIQDLLAADDAVAFEDMVTVCADVAYMNANWQGSHEMYGLLFTPFIRAALENDTTTPPDVVACLRDWDGHFADADGDGWWDSPAATIFQAWYERIDRSIFSSELGDIGGGRALLLHVLQGNDSPLDLQYDDYLDGRDRDGVIVATLTAALENLTAVFGTSDISAWRTPVTVQTFDEQGALPARSMPYMDRGTYNMVVELPLWSESTVNDPPRAVSVLPPGQSGFVNATGRYGPHAYDQLDLYTGWTFKPMLFDREEILAVGESVTTLQWPG
jgi:penicillin amidase